MSVRDREIAERAHAWLDGGEPQDIEEIADDVANDAAPTSVLYGVIGQLLDELAADPHVPAVDGNGFGLYLTPDDEIGRYRGSDGDTGPWDRFIGRVVGPVPAGWRRLLVEPDATA